MKRVHGAEHDAHIAVFQLRAPAVTLAPIRPLSLSHDGASSMSAL
jgi:hypothetical protein